MGARAGEAAPGVYAERDPSPVGGLEAALAMLGYQWHRAFAARLRGEALARGIRERAARLDSQRLREAVPGVRYRLRKDGIDGEGAADCLALCAAAVWPDSAKRASPAALAGAQALIRGRIAMIAEVGARTDALLLAACAMALAGAPVHIAAATDLRAAQLAEALGGPLQALGMRAAVVVPGMDLHERCEAYCAEVACASLREFALDYLRDRLRRGRSRGVLREHVARLAEDGPTGSPLLLRGLHCALVDQADAVMIDGALVPVAIAREAAPAYERLPLEQALELARVLAPGRHFELDDGAAQLTQEGAGRVARLAGPLDALRLPEGRREELVSAALVALYGLHRDANYTVQQGRVLRTDLVPGWGETDERDGVVQAMLEVKEGLPLSGRRELQGRVSVPGFLRRYLHLAGVCRPDDTLPAEFWELYGRKTAASATGPSTATCSARAFATTDARRNALVEAAREALEAGEVLIALRSHEEAKVFAEALAQAGLAGRVGVTVFPAHRAAMAGTAPRLLVGDLHDAARHVAEICESYSAVSCCQFVSLEEPVAARLGASAAALARAGAGATDELAPPAARLIVTEAQRAAEHAAAAARRDALRRERQLESILAFTGGLD